MNFRIPLPFEGWLLTLAELEATTCFTFTEFLTLYRTWVTCHQAFLLQCRAIFCIHFAKNAGNTHLDRFSLAFRTTTLYIDNKVKCFSCFDGFQWQLHLVLQVHEREVVLILLAIHRDI